MATDNSTRTCKNCKATYPLTAEWFNTYSNRVGDLLFRHLCRECWKQHRAEGRKRRDPEKIKAEKRRNVEKHPEAAKARRDRHIAKKLAEDPEYFKKKAAANSEKNTTRATKWIEDNRDKFNARQRKRRVNNPIVKAKESVIRHTRRARMRNAEGSYTDEDILHIFEEQEGRCAYCGITLFWSIKNDVHIDHIIPLARGGTNWPSNLNCTCKDCNLSKGDKTLDEWIVARGW